MDGPALRAHALDALGSTDPPRAAEILAGAGVVLVPETSAWTSSEGVVHGRTVIVSVDARTLGELRVLPATADSIQNAIAHALGRAAGMALSELTWVWSGTLSPRQSPYRGAILQGGTVAIGEAVVDWLEGAVETEAAAFLRTATVTRRETAVMLLAAASPTPHVRGAIEAALRDLYGAAAKAFFRVR